MLETNYVNFGTYFSDQIYAKVTDVHHH